MIGASYAILGIVLAYANMVAKLNIVTEILRFKLLGSVSFIPKSSVYF